MICYVFIVLDHNEEKIHSIIWIVISLLIIKSTDMFNMLRTSEEINMYVHIAVRMLFDRYYKLLS